MIGTIIIAVIGYGLSIICALGGCRAFYDAGVAAQKGDVRARREEIGTFAAAAIFATLIATVTRWLTGGQF